MSTFRNMSGKPYKYRENFDKFETEHPEDFLYLQRLENFFRNYSSINPKIFFKAPFILYKDGGYFDLKYYTSQRAIKGYTTYLKQLEEELPDSKNQLEFIKDSLLHIKDFCINNNITVSEYLKHRKGVSLTWMCDVVKTNISPYLVVGLSYFNLSLYSLIDDTPEDECEMLLGGLLSNYPSFKTKMDNSKHAKTLVIKGIQTINNILKNNKCNANILEK